MTPARRREDQSVLNPQQLTSKRSWCSYRKATCRTGLCVLLGGQAGTPGKAFSWLQFHLAHLQGGQVLTDAWTAHMFICELCPGSRWAGSAIFLFHLLFYPFCAFLLLSFSTWKNVEFKIRKTTGAHAPHTPTITCKWNYRGLECLRLFPKILSLIKLELEIGNPDLSRCCYYPFSNHQCSQGKRSFPILFTLVSIYCHCLLFILVAKK